MESTPQWSHKSRRTGQHHQPIGLYSPERCIADAFRLCGQLGYEIARDSLKEWLRRGGKPNSLIQVALQLPRVKTPIFRALETLS